MRRFLLPLLAICALFLNAHAGGFTSDGVHIGDNGRDDGVNYSGPGAAPYRPMSVWLPGYTAENVPLPTGSPWGCTGRDDGLCDQPPATGPFVGPYDWSLTGQTKHTAGGQ
jgi:hypothetical protein